MCMCVSAAGTEIPPGAREWVVPQELNGLRRTRSTMPGFSQAPQNSPLQSQAGRQACAAICVCAPVPFMFWKYVQPQFLGVHGRTTHAAVRVCTPQWTFRWSRCASKKKKKEKSACRWSKIGVDWRQPSQTCFYGHFVLLPPRRCIKGCYNSI